MKLLSIISSIIMMMIPIHGFAQMAGGDIVDDGGTLRMSPNPQSQQNMQQRQPGQSAPNSQSSSQTQQGGLPAGDSTQVQLPPEVASKLPADVDQQKLMEEYKKNMDQLPPSMQNLSPEQIVQQYQKTQGK